MTSKEYLILSLTNDWFYKLEWWFTVLGIHQNGYKDKYISVVDNKYVVALEDGDATITDLTVTSPLISFVTPITVTPDLVKNLTTTIESTIGRLVINKLMLSDTFGDRIPYINKQFTIKDVESTVADMMVREVINVDEYLMFTDVASFIQSLARMVVISTTSKSVLPPPGIDAYKKTMKKEFDTKYGKDWPNDRTKIIEFENLLKAKDAEWMKGDPTDGIFNSGKIKDNSRVKTYLNFGAEFGFDKTGKKVSYVEQSLLDGYPEDPDKLTTMFNTSRAGSYDRGKETQKGGSSAKDILRSTSAITIRDGDCGTVLGKTLYVTDVIASKLLGRYIIVGGKTEAITDGSKYLGKTITIRSPQYCKQPGSSPCSVCVGKELAKYKAGVSLVATDISAILIGSSMKSMHTSVVKSTTFDIRDVIK